jgi:hypothetical protein
VRKLVEEIRLLICEILLSWIVSIAPKNPDGARIVGWIHKYAVLRIRGQKYSK